ncbi:hypothetical protein EGR_01289 [Echinococcus granulosus]|uniref:Uncharacterized protein n=1 Tax=Echinococcus granulosus TaxID=6210 RepID=W6USN5_ECHGR|nr:hypothetical protein EGR_01289 [Echinococcus granulosus]EUB63666.1 hypothetical protein EGR_01289 [Echinococcus granulosus]
MPSIIILLCQTDMMPIHIQNPTGHLKLIHYKGLCKSPQVSLIGISMFQIGIQNKLLALINYSILNNSEVYKIFRSIARNFKFHEFVKYMLLRPQFKAKWVQLRRLSPQNSLILQNCHFFTIFDSIDTCNGGPVSLQNASEQCARQSIQSMGGMKGGNTVGATGYENDAKWCAFYL